MPRTMTLPKIGVNMTEAIIGEWFVKEGDTIREGDAILRAETDKATQDIYATDSGILGKRLVHSGDRVEIHQPIMVLLDEGEEYSGVTKNETGTLPQTTNKQESSASMKKVCVQESKPHGRISPLAKKLAKERGIDIADLKPANPKKRIVKADVLAFQQSPAQVAENETLSVTDDDVHKAIPLSGVRKVIASRMSQSHLEKPCAALTLTVCADAMIALRERYKASGIRVSYNGILVRVAAQALRDHRNINAVLSDDQIKWLRHIHVGVAVDSERGLVVPVIKDADTKNLREISDDLASKVSAVKDNVLTVDDMTGGTFTITNLGMFDIEQFVPIINPPECCIMAVGAMKKEFVPDESLQPMLVTTMKLTLVFDHRIVDGAPAAKFLQSVKTYIECPELLL